METLTGVWSMFIMVVNILIAGLILTFIMMVGLIGAIALNIIIWIIAVYTRLKEVRNG